MVQVMLALLVRGYTCLQPSQRQPLPANVPASDEIIQMAFEPKR